MFHTNIIIFRCAIDVIVATLVTIIVTVISLLLMTSVFLIIVLIAMIPVMNIGIVTITFMYQYVLSLQYYMKFCYSYMY